MRTLSGYLIILFLLPIFGMTVFLASEEWGHAKSIHSTLDNKIKIKNISLKQTSEILDRNGQLVSEIAGAETRYYVASKDIPVLVKNLFVVSEDRNFYQHPGFDLPAMARAMAINMKSQGISQGGSTITQQLARNIYLGQQRTYNRKLNEIMFAYQLERSLSKEKILELYLNTIYFQNGAYGIEAAAREYFNKHIGELSEGEQAFIAAIPNNPSLYNPLKHFVFTKSRQERLLDQLHAAGILTAQETAKIKAEPIRLNIRIKTNLFPDYTDYAEAELKELIFQKDGLDQLVAKASPETKAAIIEKAEAHYQEVVHSGLVVHTALDPALQNKTISAVQKNLPYPGVEGAATVIRQKDHTIVAMAGGKAYRKYEFNRAYQAFRQPGSSIKPLLDYAPYFERKQANITQKINAGTFCSNGYCPENYGNAKYGYVTLESAFIHSYNTPALRLLQTTGISNAFKDLNLFHFQNVTSQDQRLPAGIGGFYTGMSPLEMTRAYTVFGTGGSYQPSRAIVNVTDRQGKILYTWDDKPVKVWSQKTVDKVRVLMKETLRAGTAKRAYIQAPYAGGKTGTTNDYKDYWLIGLTDELTIGVWVGKDKPQSMESIEKKGPHLMIWKDIAKN